jgi:mRNA deadenylase 3'-5' endonuclease subunit Ccr4
MRVFTNVGRVGRMMDVLYSISITGDFAYMRAFANALTEIINDCIIYLFGRFSQIMYKAIEYNDLAKNLEGPDKEELYRENVGQILALSFKDKDGGDDSHEDKSANTTGEPKGLVITNTHLFWNYRYSFPRLKQAIMLLEHTNEMNKNLQFPVVLCGDWNMTPDSVCILFPIPHCMFV